LEKFSLSSIAKKASSTLTNTFKFITEGAKLIQKYNPVNVAREFADSAKEIIKIADGEVKKFMKVAKAAYQDVVSLVQKMSREVVDFAAENADLLKTISSIAGQVGGALVTVAPQLMNAIPGWCVYDFIWITLDFQHT
jgi:thiamine biosynthesis lipoprotein ApbE